MDLLAFSSNPDKLGLKSGKFPAKLYSISIKSSGSKFKEKLMQKIFYLKIFQMNNRIKSTLMTAALMKSKDSHSPSETIQPNLSNLTGLHIKASSSSQAQVI
jgi:hypothetical protein